MENNKQDWKDEFIKLMFPIDPNDIEFERALNLKNNNIPKSIFRYYSINVYSLINLQNNTVWLAAPKVYNDPYDSSLVVNLEYDLSKLEDPTFLNYIVKQFKIKMPEGLKEILLCEQLNLKEKLSNIIKLDNKNRSNEDVEQMVNLLFKAYDHVNNKNLSKVGHDSNRENLRICSFSEVGDSVVMWSHYAANHTGFCLEYDKDQLKTYNVLLNLFYPVIYKSELFDESNYHKEIIDNFNKTKSFEDNTKNPDIAPFNIFLPTLAAMHKSIEWSYEKEWRIIIQIGSDGKDYMEFQMPRPKTILLGSKMSEGDKEIIKKIALNLGITVFQMYPSSTEFKMIAKPISNPSS